MKNLFFVVLMFVGFKAFATGHAAIAIGNNASCNGLCDGSASVSASGGIGPYGYSWTGPSGFSATGQNISSLCAGTYIVTAIDSSDMSTAADTLNITQPPAMNVTVNSPTICAGMTANLTAGGATSYVWTAGATSTGVNTASATPATTTTYTVTGTTSGCTGTAISTVTVNPIPVITVNAPTICPGQTATLTANGAITYNWSPGGSATVGNPITVTPTTTMTFTVTGNSMGCIGTATTTVTVSPAPNVALNMNPATCGLCNGSISNSTSGAVSYSWTGPSAYSSSDISPTNLCVGMYTLTATGGSGCSTIVNTPVLDQPGPTVTIGNIINSTCGMNNGSMTAFVSGGTAPYNYTWAPGGGTSTTASGLVAGSYTVTVTDVNGCTVTASAVISTSAGITNVNLTSADANCGINNGTVTIGTVTGGTAPYSYSFNGGAYSATTFYGSLGAGSYPVTVQDANGCTYTTSANISNIGGPTACTITTTNSNCSSATGQLNFGSVSGGTAPYTFSVDGSAYSTSTNYINLAAGTHTALVQDINGCILSQNVTISNTSAPVITLDSLNNISCSGSNAGSIYISVSGGTPGYTHIWNTGSTTEDQTGLVVVGSYSVTVIDAAGCSAVQSFFIGNASTLHGAVTVVNGNCGPLGTAIVTAIGGVPPYTFSWNTVPVQTNDSISGLSNGTYACSISDAAGCINTVYASINNNCYNIIKGRIYNDINGNCIQDSGEPGLAGRTVQTISPSGWYGYTNANGDYTIYTYSMSNTVTQNLPPYAFQSCPAPPANPTANFTVSGDTIYNVDFANQFTANINDLQISYFPGIARPGFVQQGTIIFKNIGTTVMNSVTIDLTHDSILTYNYSTPASATYSYPNIGWNIGTLNPGQTGSISSYFTVPVISSGGYLGRVLSYSAQINPVSGDTTPANNISNTTRIIQGSYDPNEKEVWPAGNILVTDSILTYKIQFQNTGTDTAFTVVLKDTLSAYLDPATVEPGFASHPYVFNLSFNGELTWTFNNILLVDSTTNEPASHGFAMFTVKLRPNNPIGTQIDNTAHIYFDFNEAVVTNTVTNTLVDPATGIETESSNNSVKVYPNPFSESTTFVIQSDNLNETYSFELFDVLGKAVRSINNISEKQFTVSRNELQNGMYFYNIRNANGAVGKGKLIIK